MVFGRYPFLYFVMSLVRPSFIYSCFYVSSFRYFVISYVIYVFRLRYVSWSLVISFWISFVLCFFVHVR